MPKIIKRIYDFDKSINDFMIYCTNNDFSKKTIKSYEGTLKLFAKYLIDEVNIFTLLEIAQNTLRIILSLQKQKKNTHTLQMSIH